MAATIFRDIYGHYDKPQGTTPTEQNTLPIQTTPYDRLVKTFLPNEFGELSNEVSSILEVCAMSMFIGGMYGGINSSKTAYLEFFQNNQATAFNDHIEAKKRLQDKVTLAFGKGAWRFGWRLTLFSTSYVTFTTAVSIYRGRNGVLEHFVAGGLAGSMYKFNAGPRGMLVGGALGSALGLVAGTATVLLLKATGLQMSDVRANSERWHKLRMSGMQAGMREHYAKSETDEMTFHTQRTQGLGDDLETIASPAAAEGSTPIANKA